MYSNNGSQWNRWDLHVHTPASIIQHFGSDDEDTWEKYILDLESLPKEFKALGINDYIFIDGYERLKNEKEKNGRLKNIDLLLPVIEFRIEKFAGVDFGNHKRINLHVIFSEEVSIENIKSQFLNTLHQSYVLEDGDEWNRVITKESLMELGAKVVESIPEEKRKGAGSNLEVGFNNLNIKEQQIFEALKRDCFTGKYLIALGKTEWAELKWTEASIATKKSIINAAHVVFTAAQSVDAFKNSKDKLKGQGVKDLLLDCSDAHYLSTSIENERIGNCFTWIKADATFEGLKQILYEPEYRIAISDVQPREPIRRIESIKFNFSKNSVIKRSGSTEEQELCIKLLKQEIHFSPYFTSIIGGRGTGKSTIINILAERLGVRTDFFQKSHNAIYIDGKLFNIEAALNETIEVKGTGEIEFVSQGQIEKLAEGDELTKMVFNERIRGLEDGFHEIDKQFANASQLLDSSVQLAFELKRLMESLKEKEKERTTYQKIIDSINDSKYKEITGSISDINAKLSLIESSKKQYEALLNSVQSVIMGTILNTDDNHYEKRVHEIVETLKDIDEIVTTSGKPVVILSSFPETDEVVKQLEVKLDLANKELQNFFEAKGTSEESIKDSKNASEKVSRASQEIESTKIKIESVRSILKENAEKTENIKALYSKAEQLVIKSIEAINGKLKTKNENVLEIRFSFDFNKESYKESLFEEFYKTFSDYHLSNTSYEDIKNLLYKLEPDETILGLSYDEFWKKLDSIIDDNNIKRTNKYVMVVTNIFSSSINYGIYRILIRKHLYNLQKYIRISGHYGPRELSASSFGQRCTAVIVTLLMTGVKPLIIDEPEAHLDNKLIADYLVDLIKVKKMDRQIIFATHNSNFVINGDSELIYILEIPDGSIHTAITPTTIEDISNREKLLKLEGGREAFLSREHKYGL